MTQTGSKPFASWLDAGNSVTAQFFALAGRADIVSLSGGFPAAELYPVDAVTQASQTVMSTRGADALGYGPVEGLADLRDEIAARSSTGALRLTRQNVLITTGSMQALDLVGKLLVNRGDTILTQAPAYLGALDAWRPREPRYIRLDTTDPTVRLDAMRNSAFTYTMPNYSNPTGAVISGQNRIALARATGETGAWLVEDDPYGALNYDGETYPSMLELSADGGAEYTGSVIYLGTFSKTIAPGLRVGFVIAQPAVIRALAQVKQGSDLSSSALCQAITAELLRMNIVETHMPMVVDAYRERRDALCETADELLEEHFTWSTPPGGMFVWITAKDARVDTAKLLVTGIEQGISFVPGSAFDPENAVSASLRLNFTLNRPEVIREGVTRLARASEIHYRELV